MNLEKLNSTMERYVAGSELSGASILVRKGGEITYREKWGFSDLDARKPIEYDSIFRMMSMTKPVTAVGIMLLYEKNLLSLDDKLSDFIPAFKDMRVACDKRYEYHEGMKMTSLLLKLPFFRMDRVKSVPAEREITLRDLLSHSSGLEQGIVGLMNMMKDKHLRTTLKEQAELYSRSVLDFQPGSGTGYSPLAGFDVLARIIEIVSGQNAETFYAENIFKPLGMSDTGFHLSTGQKARLVRLYKRKNNSLFDVTDTKEDMRGRAFAGENYISGSGGLYSTLADYDAFASMLLNNGAYNGIQLLKPDTVKLMHSEAPHKHLEPDPGTVWGLGMKIWQQPEKCGRAVTPGTYGWSGAFGTHFFISPDDDLSCVLMLNRSDLDGAGSYISKKVEELVFER